MLRAERPSLVLLEVGVHLDLVDRGDDIGCVEQLGEVPDHEVADANRTDLALIEQCFQCPVGLQRPIEVGRERLVQDQQVDLVDTELGRRRRATRPDRE